MKCTMTYMDCLHNYFRGEDYYLGEGEWGYPDTQPKLSLPGSIFRFQLPINDF